MFLTLEHKVKLAREWMYPLLNLHLIARSPPQEAVRQMKKAVELALGVKEFSVERGMFELRECRARSAKFWMWANARTLFLAPFDKFLVPY